MSWWITDGRTRRSTRIALNDRVQTTMAVALHLGPGAQAPWPDDLRNVFEAWWRAHTSGLIHAVGREYVGRGMIAFGELHRETPPLRLLERARLLGASSQGLLRGLQADHLMVLEASDLLQAPRPGLWSGIGAACALAEAYDGLAIDLDTGMAWEPAAGRPGGLAGASNLIPPDGALRALDHVAIDWANDQDGIPQLTTAGMARFGLPELELHAVGDEHVAPLRALMAGCVQHLIEAVLAVAAEEFDAEAIAAAAARQAAQGLFAHRAARHELILHLHDGHLALTPALLARATAAADDDTTTVPDAEEEAGERGAGAAAPSLYGHVITEIAVHVRSGRGRKPDVLRLEQPLEFDGEAHDWLAQAAALVAADKTAQRYYLRQAAPAAPPKAVEMPVCASAAAVAGGASGAEADETVALQGRPQRSGAGEARAGAREEGESGESDFLGAEFGMGETVAAEVAVAARGAEASAGALAWQVWQGGARPVSEPVGGGDGAALAAGRERRESTAPLPLLLVQVEFHTGEAAQPTELLWCAVDYWPEPGVFQARLANAPAVRTDLLPGQLLTLSADAIRGHLLH